MHDLKKVLLIRNKNMTQPKQVHLYAKMVNLDNIVCTFPSFSLNNSKGHVSLLVKGGKIVSIGESTLAGRLPGTIFLGRSCHAEMAALKILGRHRLKNTRKLKKYEIWNIRWTREGKVTNSKPCYHCQQSLLKLGITTIVFSTSKGTFVRRKLHDLKCKISSGAFNY